MKLQENVAHIFAVRLLSTKRQSYVTVKDTIDLLRKALLLIYPHCDPEIATELHKLHCPHKPYSQVTSGVGMPTMNYYNF